MNKCAMYLLVLILITGLNPSTHAAICDRSIAPCEVGSCMPCNSVNEQSVDKDDCQNPNGCPEVTVVKIKPNIKWTIQSAPRLSYEFYLQCWSCYLKDLNPFNWY